MSPNHLRSLINNILTMSHFVINQSLSLYKKKQLPQQLILPWGQSDYWDCICGVVLITLIYFSILSKYHGRVMCAPHRFHRVGRIFSKKGEKRGGGGKNRKTRNMQCISTGLKGFCFANNVYIPCVGVKGIERVHAGMRLRLGTRFQIKHKPR